MPHLDRNHNPSIPFGSSKKTSKNLKNPQNMFSSAPRPFVFFLLAAACCLVVDSCFAAATKHHKKEKEPTAKKHAGPKLMDETSRFSKCNAAEDVRIHDFEVETLKGDYVDLNAYKGQIVLVVNVASFCAFTQQYNDFNPLIEKNLAMGRNFSILAFPCNQFHLQEPAENQEILNGLAHVRPGDGWKPHQNLHIFGKVDVNGDDHIPLFEFLKDSCPETVKRIGTKEEMFYNPIRSNDITWNFEKFLVDAEGRPRFRFHPTVWQHGRVIQKYIDILAAEGGSEKAAKQENELAKLA